MFRVLFYVFLLMLTISSFASSIVVIDVTHEELEELGAACPTLDTCTVDRTSESLAKYTCDCSSDCYKLGTCCVDARYRNKPFLRRKPSCRTPNGKIDSSYFMVDFCPTSRNKKNSMYEKMCKEDFKGDDNLMSLVPVTSLSSNKTYKNYFCFKCNEVNEKYLYWNVRINANGDDIVKSADAVPRYDKVDQTWIAPVGKNGKNVSVIVIFGIPDEIRQLPKVCVPDVISNCSEEWRLKDVKSKCAIYTSYIYIKKDGYNIGYRNPHCALCNFENLENMGCGVKIQFSLTSRRPFSFTQLLDINRRDGDKVGYITRCDEDATWDPYFKKCRKLTCAVPGYKIKERKCVPP